MAKKIFFIALAVLVLGMMITGTDYKRLKEIFGNSPPSRQNWSRLSKAYPDQDLRQRFGQAYEASQALSPALAKQLSLAFRVQAGWEDLAKNPASNPGSATQLVLQGVEVLEALEALKHHQFAPSKPNEDGTEPLLLRYAKHPAAQTLAEELYGPQAETLLAEYQEHLPEFAEALGFFHLNGQTQESFLEIVEPDFFGQLPLPDQEFLHLAHLGFCRMEANGEITYRKLGPFSIPFQTFALALRADDWAKLSKEWKDSEALSGDLANLTHCAQTLRRELPSYRERNLAAFLQTPGAELTGIQTYKDLSDTFLSPQAEEQWPALLEQIVTQFLPNLADADLALVPNPQSLDWERAEAAFYPILKAERGVGRFQLDSLTELYPNHAPLQAAARGLCYVQSNGRVSQSGSSFSKQAWQQIVDSPRWSAFHPLAQAQLACANQLGLPLEEPEALSDTELPQTP